MHPRYHHIYYVHNGAPLWVTIVAAIIYGVVALIVGFTIWLTWNDLWGADIAEKRRKRKHHDR